MGSHRYFKGSGIVLNIATLFGAQTNLALKVLNPCHGQFTTLDDSHAYIVTAIIVLDLCKESFIHGRYNSNAYLPLLYTACSEQHQLAIWEGLRQKELFVCKLLPL